MVVAALLGSVAGGGMVVPRALVLRAWDGILILIVLGLLLGRVFRALGSSLEAETCAGTLVSCNDVEDGAGAGAGASAKLGVSLAVAGVVGEVVGVDDVGDFKAFFLPVERVILGSSCG